MSSPQRLGTHYALSRRLDLGIQVLIIILHGIWSDVILARGTTSVRGNLFVQFTKVKNESIDGGLEGDI
jgi:hypothetical protein